jgi:hypothetical protein
LAVAAAAIELPGHQLAERHQLAQGDRPDGRQQFD